MTPVKTFIKIQRDSNYLAMNYAMDFAVTLSLIVLMGFLGWKPEAVLGDFAWMLLPFAIVWGCMISSFLHNASHENIGNSFTNRLAGEFCGAWVLYGFSNFVMIHLLHHRYSDEKHDPVHPGEMNFFVFLSAPMRYMIRVTKDWLREQHGNESDYEMKMNVQIVLFHVNLILKVVLWHKIFGTELFTFFYLPALLANYGILAHINYVCHRDNADGSVEIVNLNHNAYYRFANFITFGGYFHKNHHVRLNVFNPMKLTGRRYETRYFTIKAEHHNVEAFPMKHPEVSALKNYFDLHVWGEAKKLTKNPVHNTILITSARDALKNANPATSSMA